MALSICHHLLSFIAALSCVRSEDRAWCRLVSTCLHHLSSKSLQLENSWKFSLNVSKEPELLGMRRRKAKNLSIIELNLFIFHFYQEKFEANLSKWFLFEELIPRTGRTNISVLRNE